MLKKVTQDNMDINLAMVAWRNTPTEGSISSKATVKTKTEQL